MAWIRQLHTSKCPGKTSCQGCGKWAATVKYGPGRNDRITQTDRLKGVVEDWAKRTEADVQRGKFHDPRPAAKTMVRTWWELTRGSRHQEMASKKRDESHWKVHVEPRWGDETLGSITKTNVSKWVVEMEQSHRDDCRRPKTCNGCRVGAATVEGAVGVLRGLLDQAVDEDILQTNPAQKVKMRPRDAHVDRVLDVDEEKLVVARAGELFGDRVDGLLFIELMLDTGLRWEEVAAIPPELIDTRRQRIHIAWVMERNGTARPYGKSDAGNRTVAYGDHLMARLTAAKLAAPSVPDVFPVGGAKSATLPTRLVFYSPGGGGRTKRKRGVSGAVDYTNWLRGVWRKVLLDKPTLVPKPEKKPGQHGRPGPPRRVPGLPLLDNPQPTPHDMRHTYATRLANHGVPVHDLMRLLGHADLRSVQRYMHSQDDRFDRALKAMRRARGLPPKDDEQSATG